MTPNNRAIEIVKILEKETEDSFRNITDLILEGEK